MIDGVEQLETYFGQFLPQFLIALLSPILIFAVVAFIDLPVALVMLGFALVALFAPALWHKCDVKNSQRRQTAYASFAAEFLDSIQGLATLKAFGQGKARADKLEVEARDLFRRTMWVLGTNSLARGITDTSIACGAAAALIYGASRVEAGAHVAVRPADHPDAGHRNLPADARAAHRAAPGHGRPLGRAGHLPHPRRQARCRRCAARPRSTRRWRRPSSSRTCASPIPARGAPCMTGSPSAPRRASGWAWSGRRAAASRRSCACCCASTIPTAAASCSAATTCAACRSPQIRSLISVVNQDTFLFHGTVEENIRLGRPDATQPKLEDAARAANIHDFILSLPQGYATVIGEKGIKLSGGQRQRVAIARALLRDTPILVLDEALSAVDAENEAVIQEALDRLMQGRTTLILAHRLSSVIDCDRILVLDGGKVAEQGRHDALMARGGVYAGLMAEQAREQHGADAARADRRAAHAPRPSPTRRAAR